MTALGGFWNFARAADPEEPCRRILHAQQLYAPDAPAVGGYGEVAIGRRLFRTLPEDVHDRGVQGTASDRWRVVADVRIDNRADLCTALGLGTGAELSDAAILHRALERWNEGACDRLVGDFAFAAWEASGQRLLLARDPLGQRPLHYARADGFFAFASMPKGLHALPEIPSAPDEEAVADFLALMPDHGSRSFFRGIERVLPGHYCEVTRDRVRPVRYWDPRPKPLILPTPDDYADAVREALDRAVAATLRGSGGTTGVFLSGGFDSGAVASAAALAAPDGRVTGFTAVPREGYDAPVPRGRTADEGPLAASVAALYRNMDHVLIRTAGRSPFETMDRNFYLFDRPVLGLCNNLWTNLILDEAKKRRIGVMLTGTTGNLSFSYAGLERISQLIGRGRLLKASAEAWKLRRSGLSPERIAAQAIGSFLPRRLWLAINRARGRELSIENYSAVREERVAERMARIDATGLDLSYRPRRDPLEMRLWVMRRVDVGNYNKGWLGGWGIDVRDPTADRRLVELCLSIPVEQFLREGQPRALARRVLAGRLPDAVLNQSSSGLQSADWHETLAPAKSEAAEQIGRMAAVPEARHVLDFDRLQRLLDDWPETDWTTHRNQGRYRQGLLRGVSAGHFIRKAAGSNA